MTEPPRRRSVSHPRARGRHRGPRSLGVALLAFALGASTATTRAGAQEPDDGRRARNLETFDRAWSIVGDTHFDPELGGVDWPAVRDELRPRAGAAATERELRRVIDEMLGRLGQSHFAILPAASGDADPDTSPAEPPGEHDDELLAACAPDVRAHILASVDRRTTGAEGDAGLEMRLLEQAGVVVTRVDPDGPAAKARIGTGWQLLAVDGQRIARSLACLDDLAGEALLRQLARAWVESLVAGPIGSEARLRFDTGRGGARNVVVRREAPRGELVRFGNLPPATLRFDLAERQTPRGARVAVVRFNLWLLPVAAAFDRAMPALRAADGVVIDLRGNPGGVAAIAQGVAGHFVGEKVSLGSMKSRRDDLELVVQPRRVTRDGAAVETYAGPVAILIDEGSASTSEIFAGGLRDHGRARLFGTPSAGAALPAIMDRLPNGDVLMHASMDYVRPNGERVEGRPIVPDVETELTREDLRAGRDAALGAALDWIDEEIARRRSAGDVHPHEEERNASF